jgi:Domain of unknown function (DUF4190)
MTKPSDPVSGAGQGPNDLPKYVDPAAQQQLYMDPVTGEFRYEAVAGPIPPGPSGAPYPPYGASPYPDSAPQNPAPPYPASQYPAPQHPASQYPAPQYPPYPGQPFAGQPYQGAVAPYAPYPSPYGYPAARGTSNLAIASMVLSIAGLFLTVCWGVGGLLGIVGATLGHVARRKIRMTGEGGGGFAAAGIIVGWAAAVIGIGMAILLVFAITR